MKGISREKTLWRLVRRRLRSTRATAYIEFAVMVPIFLFALLFAADFTRILYVEQQVEIATRALCDVESHLRPGARACPGQPAKSVVRTYLAEALAKEGLVSRNGRRENSVYCKGSVAAQQGPIHTALNAVIGFLKGDTKNKFMQLLGKALGKGVDIITLGTTRYMTEVFPTDKVVKTTVSVYVQPTFPFHPFTIFGRHHPASRTMLVPAVAPRGGDSKTERVRYYCHMPSMDTATVAPSTVIRQHIVPIFGKWLK